MSNVVLVGGSPPLGTHASLRADDDVDAWIAASLRHRQHARMRAYPSVIRSDPTQSARSAIIGFTRAACRAGAQHATSPAIASSRVTPPYVAGSSVLNPNNIPFINCDAAIARGTPIR